MNTIIEKIRAEVERLKNDRAFFDDNQQLAYWEGLNKVSEKLSDLEKEEKPINVWSNTPIKAKVKETGKYIMGFTDGKGHLHIPVDHNSFLQYNIDELEFDTPQEQPVCESKFKVGDVIQFKDGTNQYKICGVFSDHYINSIGNRMDMFYTDANFELVEHPVSEGLEKKEITYTSTHFTATIEKGADGLYCVYSECHIGNSYFGGFGETKEEAIKDFKKSVLEAFEENLQIEITQSL